MSEIAKLQLQKTAKLLIDQQVTLTTDPKALEQLAKEGFDPIYGARPLRRLIQSAIENPIATMLIQKQFVSGDTILIGYDTAKKVYFFQKIATPQPVDPTAPPPPPTPPVITPPVPPVPPTVPTAPDILPPSPPVDAPPEIEATPDSLPPTDPLTPVTEQ